MSTPKIKTSMEITGEKEYKAALSEINSALKVLDSELKLTKEQFVDQGNSVDALTAKHDVLERQYLTQKEKVDTLRSALEQIGQTYGEASTKTNSYRTSLNNAETDLLKLERALRENETAMDQAKSAADEASRAVDSLADDLDDAATSSDKSGREISGLEGIFSNVGDAGANMGDVVDNLAGKLGLNLPDGAKSALSSLSPIPASMAAIAGAAAGAAAGIIAVEKALIGLTTDRAEYATSIANISDTINMSVESTQLWDFVLKTLGSSIEEAQGDLSAFQEKILEASEGSGEAYEMFGKLGVAVRNEVTGSLRDTESVLLDVVHALQLMVDETERNAISSTLLGGTGEKLIPIYEQNAEALDALMEKKREIGVLTGDEIDALDKVTDALVIYEESVNRAKDVLAVEYAPYLAEFYEETGEGIKELGQAAADSGLVDFFGSLLSVVSELVPLSSSFVQSLIPLSGAIEGVADSIEFVSDAIGLVSDGLDKLESVSGIFNSLLAQSPVVPDFFKLFGNISNISNAFKLLFNAPGTDNFPGGVTWVGENGPEQVYLPRGTQILNAQESRLTGGDVFYITIEARTIQEFMDIVRMAQAQRRLQRMEG